MSKLFIPGPDSVYNADYVKSIQCDEEKCSLMIANTEHTGGGRQRFNNDKEVTCFKDKNSDCYRVLSSLARSKWMLDGNHGGD